MVAGTYAAVTQLVSAGKTKDEILAAKPTALWDEKRGKGFMKPDVFTGVLWNDALRRPRPKAP